MVSIIIPTYNYARYLTETLQSLINQSYADWECIIIDDGSTDNTRKVVDEFLKSDDRFKYIYQNNKGVSAARNAGIKLAKGDFIQFLDGDDLLQSDKIKLQIQVFEKNNSIDIAYSDVRFFDDGYPEKFRTSLKGNKPDDWLPRLADKGEKVIMQFSRINFLVMNAPLIKKAVFDKVGYFDEQMKVLEDWDFWMRCALENCFFYYSNSENGFALVRAHKDSLSSEKKLMKDGHLLFLQHSISRKNTSIKYGVKLFIKYMELFWDSIFTKFYFPGNSRLIIVFSFIMLPLYGLIKLVRVSNVLKGKIKKNVLQNILFKNVLLLFSGSALAQILTFFFTIILTRLYTTENFGKLSIFVSVASIFSLMAAGKYDIALVVAKDKSEARLLVKIGGFISIIVSILLLLFVVCYYFFFNLDYRTDSIKSWLLLLPVSVLMVAWTQLLLMYFVREKRFLPLTYSRFGESGLNGLSSILLSFFGAVGLLAGYLLGQLAALLSLSFSFKKTETKFPIDIKGMRTVARKYIEFPRINIFQGLLEIIQTSGIVLIGALYFTDHVLGSYALCLRVLQAPMGIIVKPVAMVFFAEASHRYRIQSGFYSSVIKTLLRSITLLLPLFAILMIGGPYLFELLFGAQWRESGEYAQIFAVWIFFDLLRSPLSQICSIVGKQRVYLYWSVFWTMMVIASIFVAGIYFKNTPHTAFVLVAIVQSLQAAFMTFYSIYLAKKYGQ